MHLVWDEPKRLSNLVKHGFDFADLTEAWFIDASVHPARDNRFMAIGRLGDRTIVVIAAQLGTEAISIVSMRPAKPAERRLVQ
jgi:uncharacterized DUF497 family protein